MQKINWKAKLTSRKFWAALIGFVTALLIAFAVPQATVTQIAGIIMAGATMIAYIFGEGLVDAANASNTNATTTLYSGEVIGTVPDTKASITEQTGTAQAAQVQQVTAAGLTDSTTK